MTTDREMRFSIEETYKRTVEAIEFSVGRPMSQAELAIVSRNTESSIRLMFLNLQKRFDVSFDEESRRLIDSNGEALSGEGFIDQVLELKRKIENGA